MLFRSYLDDDAMMCVVDAKHVKDFLMSSYLSKREKQQIMIIIIKWAPEFTNSIEKNRMGSRGNISK